MVSPTILNTLHRTNGNLLQYWWYLPFVPNILDSTGQPSQYWTDMLRTNSIPPQYLTSSFVLMVSPSVLYSTPSTIATAQTFPDSSILWAGDTISTVENIQYWDETNTTVCTAFTRLMVSFTMLNTLPSPVLMISPPHSTDDIPSQCWKLPPQCWTPSTVVLNILHSTEHPPQLWTYSTVLNTPPQFWISSTVLNTLHSTEHPSQYWTPFTLLNTLHSTEHPSQY